jgi:hypothetical protein
LKKAMAHNKGTSQFYNTPENKTGPHEYSASIEINMHEICYGPY